MQSLTARSLDFDFDEATVSFLHYSVGGEVNKDEPLLELTTAKAVIVVESPVAGILKKIVKVDDTVTLDTVLCEIET